MFAQLRKAANSSLMCAMPAAHLLVLTPAPGKAAIEDVSDDLAAADLEFEAAGGGPAAGTGAGAGAEQAAAARREQCARRRQWRPAFHPAFTLTGTQPQFLLPQVR